MVFRAKGVGFLENNEVPHVVECLVRDIVSLEELLVNGCSWPADDAVRVLVAAECIATMCGVGSGELPGELVEKLSGLDEPTLDMIYFARMWATDISYGGDLIEFWNDYGEGVEEWQERTSSLRNRLESLPVWNREYSSLI